MVISPKVKTFLVITGKHLVLGAFANTAMWALLPQEFNLHNWHGIGHILYLITVQVVGREVVQVWLPELLIWAKSTTIAPVKGN